MTHQLVKNITSRFEPGSPGYPSFPGQPAMPAYSSVAVQTVCSPGPNLPPGYTYQVRINPRTGKPTVFLISPTGAQVEGGVQTGANYSCRDVRTTTFHPAQAFIPPQPGAPAVASQTIINYNIGWNSGARSIASFAADGYVEFTFGLGSHGIVAGLNASDTNYSYQEIDHAFALLNGNLEVWENGASQYSQAWDPANVLRIERRVNIVYYYVDDVLVYFSATRSYGPVFLDASVYFGGDYIDSPSIEDLVGADLTMEPATMWSVEGLTCGAVLLMEPMTIESGEFPTAGAELEMEPATCFSYTGFSTNFANAILEMESATMESEAGTPILTQYAVASLFMLPPVMSAYAHAPAGAELEMVPLAMISATGFAYNYAQAILVMEPVAGVGSAYEGNNTALLSELILVAPDLAATYRILVLMNSTIEASTSMAVVVLTSAELLSSIDVSADMSTSELFNVLMQTVIQAGFSVPIFDQAAEVWAVNADTGGSTRYEQFDYNSMATIDGRDYGVRAEGLYLLEGDDDEGTAVRAMISLGKRDFSTSALKHLENAYVGVSSTGKLCLKIIVKGQEYVYTMRNSNANLAVQRFDLGKGLRANYFEFELYNKNGADFELDSVEFVAAGTNRRI